MAEINKTVPDFAETLAKGMRASTLALRQLGHAEMPGWPQSLECTPSDVPAADDPSLLVYSVLAIQTAPTSEDPGASKMPVVHYIRNEDPQGGSLFHKAFSISDDAEEVIRGSGFSKWPEESLIKVFDAYRTASLVPTGEGMTYEDKYVQSFGSSGTCEFHAEATGGGCGLLFITSQEEDYDELLMEVLMSHRRDSMCMLPS